MAKFRVLLLNSPSLLGEGIAALLHKAERVEVVGIWTLDEWTPARHAEIMPQVVIIAEPESASPVGAAITSQLLEEYQRLSVIRVGVADTVMKVHAVHRVTADAHQLLRLIHDA